MINRTVLTGRLTKDLELKHTKSDKAVASFILAVDRQFKNANGEREADFINCVVWGKPAETMANYLGKGSLVGIDGRIQTRNYENNQGTRVYVTEVNVENFTFLDTKNSPNNGNSGNRNNAGNYQPSNNRNGYNGQNNGNYGNQNNNEPVVKDDDLPF